MTARSGVVNCKGCRCCGGTRPRLPCRDRRLSHGMCKEVIMDSELDFDELLQRNLSRRDLFRNVAVAGISFSALLDLAAHRVASAATPPIGGQLIGKLEGPTTITDPSKFPKTFK